MACMNPAMREGKPVYGGRKRRNVLLLLAAEVPQERIAKPLGVSLATVPQSPRQTCKGPRSEQGAE